MPDVITSWNIAAYELPNRRTDSKWLADGTKRGKKGLKKGLKRNHDINPCRNGWSTNLKQYDGVIS